MADFRKLIMVLAIVALVAIPASAQGLQCTTVDSVNALLRAEGITELTGDTVMRGCTNNTTPSVSIQAILGPQGATDTNALVAASPRSVNAYVIIGHFNGVNDVYGPALVSSDNTTLTWESIVLPTAEPPFSITITNVRVNAQALPLTTEVTENLSVAGTSVAPLPTSKVVVGTVARGLDFSAKGTDSFPACQGHNSTVPAEPTPDFTVSFAEGFANAFKTEGDSSQNQAMEYNPTLAAIDPSLIEVTQATQLQAEFTNIPAGVSIYVSAFPIGGTNPPVTEIDGEGSGYVELDVSGGTATAVWDIIGNADQAKLQTAQFGVVVSIPEGGILVPGTGATAPILVAGSFAPLSEVVTPSATAAIPRFVDRFPTTNEAQITITACVTNLLYPYLVNVGNFDTGVAIVNTSDSNYTGSEGTPANSPFNTTAQTGTCTMYFFGENGPTAPVVTPQIGVDTDSTDAVNKHYYAFSLSNEVPGFMGYMIARCNFQYGHGYAFVSDLGASQFAQGYLALVIPDLAGDGKAQTSRAPQPFPYAPTSSGEQLGN